MQHALRVAARKRPFGCHFCGLRAFGSSFRPFSTSLGTPVAWPRVRGGARPFPVMHEQPGAKNWMCCAKCTVAS